MDQTPFGKRLRREDPLVGHARREAMIVGLVWLLAMAWSCGYCYLYGYQRDPQSIRYIIGFPDWVFFGVFVPWCICTVVAWVFSSVFIRDADLGEDPDGVSDDL